MSHGEPGKTALKAKQSSRCLLTFYCCTSAQISLFDVDTYASIIMEPSSAVKGTTKRQQTFIFRFHTTFHLPLPNANLLHNPLSLLIK